MSAATADPRFYWPEFPGQSAEIGGKARGLLEIAAAGLDTPAWFAIPAPELAGAGQLPPGMADAIVLAARRLDGESGRVAVRSSGLAEDSERHSFAGQYLTLLDVRPEAAPAAVVRCRASADSPALSAYRAATGLPPTDPGLAVIVQAMVRARCAGICFSEAPDGPPGGAVIVAGLGLGDRLAAGEAEGEEYRVGADGAVRVSRADKAHRKRVLSDDEARAIAGAAWRLAQRAGRAQDTEWAIGADGRLSILQARPITGRPLRQRASAQAQGEVRVWDNANIVESFPGVTLPLTYSVARQAYGRVYRAALVVLGAERATVAAHDAVFDQLLGYLHGRVYYNVSSWHRVLAMLPGFAANQPLMERMMGAARPGAGRRERAAPVTAGVQRRLGTLRFGLRMAAGLIVFERRVRSFERTIAELREEVDSVPLERMSPDEVLAIVDSVTARAVAAWPVTIFNDVAVMIVHGSLRRVAQAWLESGSEAIVNELLRGDGLASAAPARDLEAVAARLRAQPTAVELLRSADDGWATVRADTRLAWLAADVEDYLSRWGDRCPHELKLDQPAFRDQPAPLIAAIVGLASAATTSDERARGARIDRRAAWRQLDANLRPTGVLRGFARRRALRWLIGRSRRHLAWRERMRFARTDVFALARRLFGALDGQLVRLGVLERAGDIHYLDVAELHGLLRGTGVLTDPALLIRQRRASFSVYAAMPEPPDRFETHGPPLVDLAHRSGAWQADDGVRELRGTPVSAGVVRAPCRVVVDARCDLVTPGQIIVAHSTDPGWLPLMLAAGGLLVERGSLLSHSAIVARELGLPAVVGIAGLMTSVHDGDLVEMDAGSGTVRLMQRGATQR